jgi:Ca2+-binding EF-hand superfamily protein
MKIITTLCALAFCGALSLNAADEPKKPGKGGDKPHHTPDEAFKKLDTNNDGSVSKEEFLAGPRGKAEPAKAEEHFKKMDKDSDGKLTLEEFKAGAMEHKKKEK